MDAKLKRGIAVLTLILGAQAAALHGLSAPEVVPPVKPLSTFPARLSGWEMEREGVVEQEVQDVLKADDLLTREYVNRAENASASLFVAYFRSQRTGKAPHSPKNCLPGSGWAAWESGVIRVPTGDKEIEINRYVVGKGDVQSVVIYWYQSHNRVVASEYVAKVYLMLDSMRYNRSDTALVRVVVPIAGEDSEAATRAGISFVKAVYPAIEPYIPEL